MFSSLRLVSFIMFSRLFLNETMYIKLISTTCMQFFSILFFQSFEISSEIWNCLTICTLIQYFHLCVCHEGKLTINHVFGIKWNLCEYCFMFNNSNLQLSWNRILTTDVIILYSPECFIIEKRLLRKPFIL